MKRLILILAMVLLPVSGWGFGFGSGSGRDARAVRILCMAAPGAVVGGTTDEVTLATCTIPAGTMGLGGAVVIETLWTNQATTNSKRLKTYFGSRLIQSANNTSALIFTTQSKITVYNRNSATSQVAFAGAASSGSMNTPYGYQGTSYPNTIFSVNTANDVDIRLTGQTTLETGFTPVTTDVSGNGTVVTVDVTTHGLSAGEYIQAAGSSTAGYNADPVQVTVVNANRFTYPGTGTGTPATAPTIKRYSTVSLDAYNITLIPGR